MAPPAGPAGDVENGGKPESKPSRLKKTNWMVVILAATMAVFAVGFVVTTALSASGGLERINSNRNNPSALSDDTTISAVSASETTTGLISHVRVLSEVPGPLSLPGSVYVPDVPLERYPGSGAWSGLPSIASLDPEENAGDGSTDLAYPPGWFTLLAPTVYSRYAAGHSNPLEFVAPDNATVTMSVADLYAAPPDSLAGLVPASVATTAATLPDSLAAVLNQTGQLDLLLASPMDPDAAEQRLWMALGSLTGGAFAYNVFTLIQRVAYSDYRAFLADFAANDTAGAIQAEAATAGWPALAREGRLYTIDVRASSSLSPRGGAGQLAHAPGAMLVFTQGESKNLTVAAISLATQDNELIRYYTRASSTPTAWAQAIYFASTGMQNWMTWIGHVMQWHIAHASMGWTLKNHLAPEHPLSVAFSPIIGGNLDFLNRLNPPSDVIAATPTLPDTLEAVYGYGQFIVDHGVPGGSIPASFPNDYEPVKQADLNGLQEASFTVDEPWDQLASAAMGQRLWEVSKSYATVLLDEIYPRDSTVAHDPQLQAWLAAAADPDVGNLPISTLPETREELLPFLTYMVYGPLTHMWTDVQEMHGISMMYTNNPGAVMSDTLPNPEADYTEEYLLQNVLPDAAQLQRQVRFWGAFMYSETPSRLIPASMELSEDLYFDSLPVRHPVNQALIQQRQETLDILASVLDLYPTEYCAAELQTWSFSEQILTSVLEGGSNPFLSSANATAEVLASKELTRQSCFDLKSQRLAAIINL